MSSYELRQKIQERRKKQKAAVMPLASLAAQKEYLKEQVQNERDEGDPPCHVVGSSHEEPSDTPTECRWCGKEKGVSCTCFICDDCDEPVLPGEGCACDYCGECGESKARGDCECEE